jgi:ribosomal subunit interface protein
MKVEVRLRNIETSEALREFVARRSGYRLSRFDRHVDSVVVRIVDVNGPKGGADKRCHVTVRGRSLGAVTIEELNEDPYAAAHLALERAARTVRRELERASRSPRRGAT